MILIAGTGYIGSALADALISAGSSVVALNRTPGESIAGYPRFTCDISDPGSVAKAREWCPVEPDVIINCASSGRGGADAYRNVYLEGCKNLATTFPSSRLVFTSSTSVYAQADGSWVDESSPATPPRETGQILLETERFVISKGGTVARLAGIYGPGRSVVLQRFLEGRASVDEVPGNPEGRYLNQAHRSDIVSALALLTSTPETAAQTYNVTDDTPQTQIQLYRGLCAHFVRPLPPFSPPDLTRKRGWTNKRISNAKLRALGWSPQFPSYLDAIGGDPGLVPSIQGQVSGD